MNILDEIVNKLSNLGYNNTLIEYIITALMLIGSISFLSHYHLFKGHTKKFVSDTFMKSMLLLVIISTFLMVSEVDFNTGLFTVASAISSTGFNLDTISLWPNFSFFILIILMLVGGCSGATASGIKINRIYALLKSTIWSVKKIFSPKQIFSRKINDEIYPDKVIAETSKFIMLYLLFTAIGIFVFLQQNYTIDQSIFQSVSSIGNSGLSVIDQYTPLTMITSIFLMWVGRLELWSFMILVGYIIYNKKR